MSGDNLHMAYEPHSKFDKPYNTYVHRESGAFGDMVHENYMEINDYPSTYSDKEDETEPLFVIDKTHNFKMTRAILFESQSNMFDSRNQKYDRGAPKLNSCWNCGSFDHSLHMCPAPRDQRTINKNRHDFLMQKQTQQQQKQHYFDNKSFRNRGGSRKNVRYFVADNQSPYSDLTPGKLSDELLKALGLPQNGIPVHVYKMRKHGYPRGWLEEARDEFSGITIFTGPNESLPLPGMDNSSSDIYYCNINKKKLHSFPGFNSPCPPNSIDECEKFECPKYDPEQSLTHMYAQMKTTKTDIKAESSGNSYNEDTGFVSNETSTGEESFNSKMIFKTLSSYSRPPSSPEDGEITDDEISSDQICVESPSNETVSEKVIDDQSNSDTLESGVDTKDYINDTQLSLSNSLTSVNNDSILISSSVKRKFGDVKSETLGTPVLKNFSAYKNRPNHESFAKGMVEMVEHENLPNATGTFKKMKEILKDVRKTLNNLL